MNSIVVTGAGAGIGRAIALTLLARGDRIVAVDRDGAALDALTAGRPSIVALEGDVTQHTTLERAAALAAPLDGWVNNAAIQTEGPFEHADLSTLERTLAVNLCAPLVGCQVAVRAFLTAGRPGSIVNVSSIHARFSFPGWVAYDAAKGGIEALTRALCVEFGGRGIRSNAVAPGAVLTEATQTKLDHSPNPAATLREWSALAPSGELVEPMAVAEAVAYLLSPAARSINGQVLAVDGGMAASGPLSPPPPKEP